MKTAVLAASLLLAFAGAAQAQMVRTTPAGTSPFYGELGYSFLDANGSRNGADLSGTPGLIRGIIGYDVHPNAAVEGMLGIGVRDADNDGSVLGVNYNSNFRVRSTYGLFVKPKVNIGNFEVFGRLGYARTSVRSNITVGGVGSDSRNTHGDFAYGVGANWQFSPKYYAGLDAMRYYDKDSIRVDGLTLSVGTRW